MLQPSVAVLLSPVSRWRPCKLSKMNSSYLPLLRAGEYLQDALRQLADAIRISLLTCEASDASSESKLQVPAASFVEEAMKRGLLLVSAGPQVVRLLPPLNVTTEQMDEALSIIESVMGSMSDTETKAE